MQLVNRPNVYGNMYIFFILAQQIEYFLLFLLLNQLIAIKRFDNSPSLQLLMLPLSNLPFANAKSINTDLKLIKTYLREEFQPELKPRNLRELSNVLKSHIQKNQKSVQQKRRVRDWLIKKEMRIQPLLKFVKQISTKGTDESQDREMENNLSFIIQPIIPQQENYLKKIVYQNINGLLTQNHANRGRRKKQFGAFLKQIGFQQGAKKERSEKIGNFVGRNEEKKRKYLDITVELIQREKITGEDWALIFSQNINHKLWKIISDQVRKIHQKRPRGRDIQTTKNLLINSLLSLQRQFQDELPRNSESVSAYLQSKYLSKMEQSGKYLMDPRNGCLWGKAFLYFRAGKHKQLFTLLQNNGLEEQAKIINRCQSKLKQYKPIRERLNVYRSRQQQYKFRNADICSRQQDVFRDQIQYALAGQRKYSCDAISDPDSLDSLWIILRSTGVFYLTERDAFQEIKEQMIRYYKQHPNPQVDYIKFAYLISYQTIIRMGENQSIDKDDFVHLLIMMNKYPFLLPEKQDICDRLAEAISSYAEELSKQKEKKYVQYYLTLLPRTVFVEEGSNIIVANNIFERFSWDIIRKIVPQLFQSLLIATAQKYTRQTGNYLQGGQIFLHQINKSQSISVECVSTALDMLCRLMIKSALGGRNYDGKDVLKALHMIRNQAGRSSQLANNYMLLANFLDNQLTLRKLLIDRNYSKIFQFLQSEISGRTFFVSIDFVTGKMLEKLVQLQGQQLFFKYLKNVIKAGDLIFSTENNIDNAKWLRFQVLKVCKVIQEHEYFSTIVPEYFLEEISFE